METLPILLIVLVALVPLLDRLSKWEARRGARQAVAQADALYGGRHRFVAVDAMRFDWLDLRFYDDAQARFQALGFRLLGDVENLDATEQLPNLRTFIRVMSGDEGRVSTGIYQLKVRGPQAVFQWLGIVPRRARIYDVCSELSDGSFVATSNTKDLDTTPWPDAIDAEQLPVKTPLESVLERHRERLRQALQAVPGREARRVASLPQAVDAQDRMQLLKNEVMSDREALVAMVEGQRGQREAKDQLIREIRRVEHVPKARG